MIAFCRLNVNSATKFDEMVPVDGFGFVGLVGMIDPPKKEVKQAIDECKIAGVRVLMVTGDHPATALAIAKQVGIVTDDQATFFNQDREETKEDVDLEASRARPLVVKGADIPSFTSETWDWVIEHKEVVFARTLPEQKMLIVQEFQKRKHYVSVTGDGVNDAPALRQVNFSHF